MADRQSARVPVLLITGPVGVGKSTVAGEAVRQLRDADVSHAYVDLAQIGACWPAPADDPWQERLLHRNLACMWSNFREAGARRLLLSRVLEARSLLRHIETAVPGAEITVIRLRAPVALLHARVRAREAGGDPQWYLDAATYLAGQMDEARVEDHLIDNADRSAGEVAAEALRLVHWLA
jgi:predicted kinase